jgi:sugar phosphate isomerase/epimerase
MTDRPEQSLYLGSIALEPNRWKPRPKRQPSLNVSDWAEAARTAGFEGWELWEDHYFLADGSERDRLAGMPLPVRIFNSYVLPGIDPDADLERVAEAIRFLGPTVRGMKFNLGKTEDAAPQRQIDAAREWARLLPETVRLYCECHPGTMLETPEAAAMAFKQWPESRFAAIVHPMNAAENHLQSWFGALGQRIEHLHWQARNAERRICLLADLPETFAATIRFLKEQRYAGSHTVEFVKGLGESDESVERLFASARLDAATLARAVKPRP